MKNGEGFIDSSSEEEEVIPPPRCKSVIPFSHDRIGRRILTDLEIQDKAEDTPPLSVCTGEALCSGFATLTPTHANHLFLENNASNRMYLLQQKIKEAKCLQRCINIGVQYCFQHLWPISHNPSGDKKLLGHPEWLQWNRSWEFWEWIHNNRTFAPQIQYFPESGKVKGIWEDEIYTDQCWNLLPRIATMAKMDAYVWLWPPEDQAIKIYEQHIKEKAACKERPKNWSPGNKPGTRSQFKTPGAPIAKEKRAKHARLWEEEEE